jgi:hypothetical protein
MPINNGRSLAAASWPAQYVQVLSPSAPPMLLIINDGLHVFDIYLSVTFGLSLYTVVVTFFSHSIITWLSILPSSSIPHLRLVSHPLSLDLLFLSSLSIAKSIRSSRIMSTKRSRGNLIPQHWRHSIAASNRSSRWCRYGRSSDGDVPGLASMLYGLREGKGVRSRGIVPS